jgi:hypothetical protein
MTPHEENIAHPAPPKYQRIPYVYADDGTKLKVCTECLVPQPLGDFSKSGHCRDGIYPKCKLCCNKHSQGLYRKNGTNIVGLPKTAKFTCNNREAEVLLFRSSDLLSLIVIIVFDTTQPIRDNYK